jgi:hypothetical protein
MNTGAIRIWLGIIQFLLIEFCLYLFSLSARNLLFSGIHKCILMLGVWTNYKQSAVETAENRSAASAPWSWVRYLCHHVRYHHSISLEFLPRNINTLDGTPERGPEITGKIFEFTTNRHQQNGMFLRWVFRHFVKDFNERLIEIDMMTN